MQSIIAYTAITDGYDEPRNDVEVFSGYNHFLHNCRNAKIYKILPHKFFKADYSIWVDGNIKLTKPKEYYIDEFLKDNDIALFKHPTRDCLYEEAEAVKTRFYHDDSLIEKVTEQIESYQGFPKHNGLYACGVLIRKHNKAMEAFNNAWWAETCRYSRRDQLSFPKVLSEHAIKLGIIEGDIFNHTDFTYENHNSVH